MRSITRPESIPLLTITGGAATAMMKMEEKRAYAVRDIAALTGFSRQTVTRMFECESGVIVLKRPETMHKRGYRSIRIPHAIYERVLRTLKVP